MVLIEHWKFQYTLVKILFDNFPSHQSGDMEDREGILRTGRGYTEDREGILLRDKLIIRS